MLIILILHLNLILKFIRFVIQNLNDKGNHQIYLNPLLKKIELQFNFYLNYMYMLVNIKLFSFFIRIVIQY